MAETDDSGPHGADSPSADASRFDAAYYQRFYGNPKTRVMRPETVRRLARFLTAYIAYLEIPVRRVLEYGPGIGALRTALLDIWPGIEHTGVELSTHACAEYAWLQGSVVDFRPAGQFDFLACYDVLQYLNDHDATLALKNLTDNTAPLLFFSALTDRDLVENCDPALTDQEVFLRSASWYRARIAPSHLHLGGGLWLRQDSDVVVFDLEHS